MDEARLDLQKRYGAIAFIAVTTIVAFNVIFPKDERIPTAVTGCYQSGIAPDIEVISNGLHIEQEGVLPTKATYLQDNVGDVILTDRPLILKRDGISRYEFTDDRAGHYIRIESSNTLSIDAIDGTTISYHRARCDGD